jgi:hypothetical protein
MSGETSELGGGQPASGGGQSASGGDAATNRWDVAVAFVVCGATVGLGVFLAFHYRDLRPITSIFGIAAPVFAAAFGVSIGYYDGNKAGEQTGKRRGKQQLKAQIKSGLNSLDGHMQGVLGPIETAMTSPAGRREFNLQPDLSLRQDDLAGMRFEVAHLHGLVDARD